MPDLIITRGLPGSGKTTFAKEWVAKDREHRARVNRDDLRRMFHGGGLFESPRLSASEAAVTHAQTRAVAALLGNGFDVIVDDTNLPPARVAEWKRAASRAGAKFIVNDMRDVPLLVCVSRQVGRPDGERVPAGVIMQMWSNYIHVKAE